jgi:hypothetical protein
MRRWKYMIYKCYSEIKVITNKYKQNGVIKGTQGIILEIYDTGDYEVQFYDAYGEHINKVFAVNHKDITLL